MTRPTTTALLIGLLNFLAPLPAGAQEPAAAEPVPLYTNEDLEKFGPVPPAPDDPVYRGNDLGWEFVIEFINREHERLDAERSNALERARIRTEERENESAHRGYVPYVPSYYPGFSGRRYGHVGRAHPDRRLHELAGARGAGNDGRIVPLHARPGGSIVPLHARVPLR